MLRKLKLALLAATLFVPAAHAAPGDCGTVVLPVGAGDGPPADITSFSPLYSNTAYNQQASWLLYPNLLWINRYSQIDWSRSLATDVTTTDNQTFTVTMRPWHWSDGVPVTAGDVAYTFSLVQKLGPLWPGYGGGGLPTLVKSLTVTDPMHFVIVTTHPVNPTWFIYNGISNLAPLPEHAWKNYTLDQMFQLQSTPSFYSVVDGPLKIQHLYAGLDAVFVPNPAWEGPKPHFTRLVFAFQQGDGTVVQQVESGGTDDAAVPIDLYNYVKNLPGVHVEVLPQGIYQNVYNINFNNPRDTFFHDVRVRQAMIDSIDQNAITKGLQNGFGNPAYGAVPVSMKAMLTPDMRKGIYPVGYDPAKARALLEEAGWKPGPDGIRVKDGKRLSFTVLLSSGSGAQLELVEVEQAYMRRVGIEMKIRLMDFNQVLQIMGNHPHEWDATVTGLSVNNYPTGESQFETGAGQNFGGYSDPKMDALIQASITQPGTQALYDYETYLSAQQPVIFGPRGGRVIMVSNRLHGISNFINLQDMLAPDALYCTGGPRN